MLRSCNKALIVCMAWTARSLDVLANRNNLSQTQGKAAYEQTAPGQSGGLITKHDGPSQVELEPIACPSFASAASASANTSLEHSLLICLQGSSAIPIDAVVTIKVQLVRASGIEREALVVLLELAGFVLIALRICQALICSLNRLI